MFSETKALPEKTEAAGADPAPEEGGPRPTTPRMTKFARRSGGSFIVQQCTAICCPIL